MSDSDRRNKAALDAARSMLAQLSRYPMCESRAAKESVLRVMVAKLTGNG